jgi:hypothetical protein
MAASAEIEPIMRIVIVIELRVASTKYSGRSAVSMHSCFGSPFVHPSVDPADAAQVCAGAGDLREILLMRS